MNKRIIRKEKGITLIALIITIVTLIILAGVSINLLIGEDGLIGRAKKGSATYSEQQAKEKLELVLVDIQVDKMDNKNYNQNEYLTSKIEENNMTVNGDVIFVNGWQFEIDRSVPKISASLGKGETINNLYIDFSTGINGFTFQDGSVQTNENGLTYETFPTTASDGVWYKTQISRQESNTLSSSFEISSRIIFNNSNTYNMGGVEIELLKDGEQKCILMLKDGWDQSYNSTLYASIENNFIYENTEATVNGDGFYKIIGDETNVCFYKNDTLLGKIDYVGKILYDEIKINFLKYKDNKHNVPIIYVKDLYIGKPQTTIK